MIRNAIASFVEYFFLSLCGMASILTLSVLVFWLFIDVNPPITYNSIIVTDVTGRQTTTFKAGDTMVITRNFCVKSVRPVDYDRRLVREDGKAYFFVNAMTMVLDAGCGAGTLNTVIPPNVPAGRYRYVVTGAYVNNPLNRGVVRAPAPLIEIVE